MAVQTAKLPIRKRIFITTKKIGQMYRPDLSDGERMSINAALSMMGIATTLSEDPLNEQNVRILIQMALQIARTQSAEG